MKFYIIADTHFNHDEIITYCERPENHEQLMFSSMKQIRENDCLVHLGDICIRKDHEMHDKYIKPLGCKKVLCKGNHDSKSYTWYMDNGWDFVCDSFKIEYAGYDLCLSHRPLAWDGYWEINVHGHLHNLGHRDKEHIHLKRWNRLYSPERYDYKCVELANFIQTV